MTDVAAAREAFDATPTPTAAHHLFTVSTKALFKLGKVSGRSKHSKAMLKETTLNANLWAAIADALLVCGSKDSLVSTAKMGRQLCEELVFSVSTAASASVTDHLPQVGRALVALLLPPTSQAVLGVSANTSSLSTSSGLPAVLHPSTTPVVDDDDSLNVSLDRPQHRLTFDAFGSTLSGLLTPLCACPASSPAVASADATSQFVSLAIFTAAHMLHQQASPRKVFETTVGSLLQPVLWSRSVYPASTAACDAFLSGALFHSHVVADWKDGCVASRDLVQPLFDAAKEAAAAAKKRQKVVVTDEAGAGAGAGAAVVATPSKSSRRSKVPFQTFLFTKLVELAASTDTAARDAVLGQLFVLLDLFLGVTVDAPADPTSSVPRPTSSKKSKKVKRSTLKRVDWSPGFAMLVELLLVCVPNLSTPDTSDVVLDSNRLTAIQRLLQLASQRNLYVLADDTVPYPRLHCLTLVANVAGLHRPPRDGTDVWPLDVFIARAAVARQLLQLNYNLITDSLDACMRNTVTFGPLHDAPDTVQAVAAGGDFVADVVSTFARLRELPRLFQTVLGLLGLAKRDGDGDGDGDGDSPDLSVVTSLQTVLLHPSTLTALSGAVKRTPARQLPDLWQALADGMAAAVARPPSAAQDGCLAVVTGQFLEVARHVAVSDVNCVAWRQRCVDVVASVVQPVADYAEAKTKPRCTALRLACCFEVNACCAALARTCARYLHLHQAKLRKLQDLVLVPGRTHEPVGLSQSPSTVIRLAESAEKRASSKGSAANASLLQAAARRTLLVQLAHLHEQRLSGVADDADEAEAGARAIAAHVLAPLASDSSTQAAIVTAASRLPMLVRYADPAAVAPLFRACFRAGDVASPKSLAHRLVHDAELWELPGFGSVVLTELLHAIQAVGADVVPTHVRGDKRQARVSAALEVLPTADACVKVLGKLPVDPTKFVEGADNLAADTLGLALALVNLLAVVPAPAVIAAPASVLVGGVTTLMAVDRLAWGLSVMEPTALLPQSLLASCRRALQTVTDARVDTVATVLLPSDVAPDATPFWWFVSSGSATVGLSSLESLTASLARHGAESPGVWSQLSAVCVSGLDAASDSAAAGYAAASGLWKHVRLSNADTATAALTNPASVACLGRCAAVVAAALSSSPSVHALRLGAELAALPPVPTPPSSPLPTVSRILSGLEELVVPGPTPPAVFSEDPDAASGPAVVATLDALLSASTLSDAAATTLSSLLFRLLDDACHSRPGGCTRISVDGPSVVVGLFKRYLAVASAARVAALCGSLLADVKTFWSRDVAASHTWSRLVADAKLARCVLDTCPTASKRSAVRTAIAAQAYHTVAALISTMSLALTTSHPAVVSETLHCIHILVLRPHMFSLTHRHVAHVLGALNPVATVATSEFRDSDLVATAATVCYAVLRHRSAAVMDVVPVLVNLLCGLMTQVLSGHFAPAHAMSLTRVLEEMTRTSSMFRHYTPYLLGAYVDATSKHNPSSAVREYLMPGVYALFDMAKSEDLQQLYATLSSSPGGRALLKLLNEQYTKHHKFTGKV